MYLHLGKVYLHLDVHQYNEKRLRLGNMQINDTSLKAVGVNRLLGHGFKDIRSRIL